jgi:predicted site-specific integrase-resolvase
MPATAAEHVPCLRSVRQAADFYGINPQTIRDWIRAGLISSYRVGPKLIMVDLDEIRARVVRRVSSPRDEQEAGQ